MSLVEVPVCFLEYRGYLLGVGSLLEHGNQGSSRALLYLFAEYILFVYKRYFFLLLLLRCILGLCHLFFSFFSGLFVVPL